MKSWGYGINGLYRSCSIHLEKAPWYVFAVEHAVNWLCDHMPEWKIPFVGRIHIKRDGEDCTVAGWYGDTVADLFCFSIHHPVLEWVFPTSGLSMSIWHGKQARLSSTMTTPNGGTRRKPTERKRDWAAT